MVREDTNHGGGKTSIGMGVRKKNWGNPCRIKTGVLLLTHHSSHPLTSPYSKTSLSFQTQFSNVNVFNLLTSIGYPYSISPIAM
jgi:hypothetical protein